MRAEPSGWDECPCKGDQSVPSVAVSVLWEFRKQAATGKPGTGSFPKSDHAGTLVSDFSLQKLGQNKCLLFKPLTL